MKFNKKTKTGKKPSGKKEVEPVKELSEEEVEDENEDENSDTSDEEQDELVGEESEEDIKMEDDEEEQDSDSDAPPEEVKIAKKPEKVENGALNEKKIVYDKSDEKKTVFCGNIPNGFNVNETRIKDLFGKFGPIKSIRIRSEEGKVLLNKKAKKKAAVFNAYIVFETLEDATKSLELNGHEILGHHLRVNMANKKKEAFSNKGTVFVGNLPFESLENDIYNFFTSVGKIEYVRKIPKKGIAYVRFDKGVNIAKALKLTGETFGGRQIRVSRCESQPKQEKKKLFKKDEKTGKVKKQKVKKEHKIKENVLMSGRANNNPIVKKIRENQKGKFNKFSGDNQVSKKEMFRKGGKMDQNAKTMSREKTKKKQTFAGAKVGDIDGKSKKIKKNKVSKSIKEQKVIVKKLKSAASREKKG